MQQDTKTSLLLMLPQKGKQRPRKGGRDPEQALLIQAIAFSAQTQRARATRPARDGICVENETPKGK